MDVLKNLLRIKLFREDMAERELTKARQRLREANEALKVARKTLKDFQSESLQREKEMYSDLCSRLVVLREIDDVRSDVELMKEKTERLMEQVDNAELRQQDAVEEADQARLAHRDAVRMREKFSELLREVEEDHESEFARFEDLEIEEAAAGRFAFQIRTEDGDDIVDEASP